MKMTIRLIFLLLLASGWLLATSSVYVVRTSEFFKPIVIVPRSEMAGSWRQIKGFYVDTRNWTAEDAAKNPDVVNRLVQTGKADLIKHVLSGQKPMSMEAQLVELTHQMVNRKTTVAALQTPSSVAAAQPYRTNTKTRKKSSARQDKDQTNWADLLGP